VYLSANFCRNLNFLQKGYTFLQKFKISAERGTPFCRNLRFLKNLQKSYISAEGVPFCRNLRFMQKSYISAERYTFLQKFKISAEICRKLRFLQKGDRP
jgi:hypothetical protein